MAGIDKLGPDRLDVWQRAIDLAVAVYPLAHKLPVEERFELAAQMRRAVVSIASNIAEGDGRHSAGDFARSLVVARGERAEVYTQLVIAIRLGYLTPDEVEPAFSLLARVGALINATYRSARAQALAERRRKRRPSKAASSSLNGRKSR